MKTKRGRRAKPKPPIAGGNHALWEWAVAENGRVGKTRAMCARETGKLRSGKGICTLEGVIEVDGCEEGKGRECHAQKVETAHEEMND